MSSATPVISQSIADRVVTITLNRPEKRNALNKAMLLAIGAALDEIEATPAIRAVILTGSGDAFSAGADIAEVAANLRNGTEVAVREFVRAGQQLTSRMEAFPKPIIAAVNGLAYGGGCEITEAVPLAVASERARFAKAEIKLGFPPTFGGTQRLPRLIGRKRALRMILTAEPIDAEEAARLGLVNSVVPHEQLLSAAHSLAQSIAAMSPLAVSAALAATTRGINLSIDEGLAVEASQFAWLVATNDIREGVDAFLAKRAPRFTGT
jgi:enoyl-CoA hydratase